MPRRRSGFTVCVSNNLILQSMNKSLVARIVQILLVLACVVAPLVTVAWVARLGHRFMPFYVNSLSGQRLPDLTMFVLQVTDVPSRLVRVSGELLIIICFVAAVALERSAAKTDASSVRLLAFVSVVWAASLGALGTAAFSFALPLFQSEEVSLDGGRVAPLLRAVAVVDRAALGFTSLPTNGWAHLEMGLGTGGNWRLHIYGVPERIIMFRQTARGCQWIAEREIYSSPKTFRTIEGWTREQLVVQYQSERINDLPVGKTSVRYAGTDPRLARRSDLTPSDVAPIVTEWTRKE